MVTGHTGFKGSWLSLWLHGLGAEVRGYSVGVPTTPSLHECAKVAELVPSVEGDVADLDRLTDAVEQYRPDVIFHMAAQSLVRPSYDDPVGTFRTNVMGTVHLLESVRRVGGVQVVVNVTSDKCYRNKEWEWGYRESDELGGSDPYSSSKACAELVGAAYSRSFFRAQTQDVAPPSLASVRAGNVIGGGDWSPDRLVPDAVRAASDGTALVVRNPHSVRPWQHVLDCLDGYLLLAEHMAHDPSLGGPWNFGPDDANTRSVGWLAGEFAALLGSRTVDRLSGPIGNRHEAGALRLDSSRARTRLGWRPRLSIDEAVRLTAAWYRAVRHDGDARAITSEQLDAYSEGRLEVTR